MKQSLFAMGQLFELSTLYSFNFGVMTIRAIAISHTGKAAVWE